MVTYIAFPVSVSAVIFCMYSSFLGTISIVQHKSEVNMNVPVKQAFPLAKKYWKRGKEE